MRNGTTQARGELEQALSSAQRTGLLDSEFEVRLALGKLEIKSGFLSLARRRLQTLERDARAKGFLLIARKVAEALNRKQI